MGGAVGRALQRDGDRGEGDGTCKVMAAGGHRALAAEQGERARADESGIGGAVTRGASLAGDSCASDRPRRNLTAIYGGIGQGRTS